MAGATHRDPGDALPSDGGRPVVDGPALTPDRLRTPRAVASAHGALLRYRVMAYTTAVLLIVLVFVGIPLQVAAGSPQVVNVVGTMHGFLYLVYLVVAFDLTRRLGIPRWQMVLVLLAGTVPFCAFVAERKLTRRFEAAIGDTGGTRSARERLALGTRASAARRRWLSPRALLLHAEVIVIAPACALAGWWQATRALGGHTLSWVYSVEWPVFAILAIAGWWHLVHEDPEAYRARRQRADDAAADPAPVIDAGAASWAGVSVDPVIARVASRLAIAVGIEFVLGIVALVAVPFSRPSEWFPAKGQVIYVVHASVGIVITAGAIGLVVMANRGGRVARIAAWTGAVCVGVAAVGGLMTEVQSIVRFLGIALMLAGSVLGTAAYVVPSIVRAQRRAAAEASGSDPAPAADPTPTG